jgi:hypothetical protein
MKNKTDILAKAGNYIGKNKVALLYVGGAVVLLFAVPPLVRKLRSVLSLEGEKAKEYDFVKEIQVNTSKATINQDQAGIMSNQLVNYMSTSGGTDEDGIQSVFNQIQNEDDMKTLYKAFGIRKYSYVNQGEASGLLFGLLENAGGYDDLDLLGWLEAELGYFDWNTKKVVNEKLALMGLSIS